MNTPQEIFQAVALAFGVNPADITGHRRAARVAYPRFAAYKLLLDLPYMSLAEAGRICGERDHSTIRHGLKKAEGLLVLNPHFKTAFEAAQKHLTTIYT